MSDPRLSWLSSALSGLKAAGASPPDAVSLGAEPAVAAWLAGGPQSKLLSAYVLSAERDANRTVRFTNEVGALAQAAAEDAPAAEVHLIRLDGGAGAAAGPDGTAVQQSAEEFAKQVLVTNTGGNAVLGLYELIHSVFAPKLLGGSDSTLASKLQREVTGLESKLHMLSLLGSGKAAGAGAGAGAGSSPELDVSTIKSVSDEVDYWAALKETAGGHAAVRAQEFLEKLSSPDCELGVRWEWSALQKLKGDELSRLLDDTQYVLSELWLTVPDRGDAYPQQRMEHLLHLLTQALLQATKHTVRSETALWTDPFPRVKESLMGANAVLNQWQNICDDLVANEFGSRWKRAPATAASPISPTASAAAGGAASATPHAYDSPALRALVDRLDEILRLRSVHEELLHLLSPEDAHSFKLDSFFDSFHQSAGAGAGAPPPIDALNVGPYAHAKWAGAVSELDRLLSPAETHASTLLKNRLYALADRPELLMQEFAQFSALLRRPAVARALENERKTLLQQLSTRLDELKQNFESYSNEYSSGSSASSAPPTLKNQPSVFLARIVWANQLSHRLGQILAIVSSVLGGIAGQERFHSLASDLRRRIDAYAKELFERWHTEVQESLNDSNSPIRLETSGNLMTLDLSGSGELVIHYSEALVTLLREVRQLQEYGYKIHDSVIQAVLTGEKYYKYGLQLKRVANFYNTIREKIVPSQMAMLLLEAQRFEGVVKGQTGARWNKPEECERFMARLMSITEELTTRNTKLKSLHLALGSQVVALFGPQYDLAKNKDLFLEAVARARGIIDKEAARNASPKEAVNLWRMHWNQQMFKVCNFQYQWLLETLNGDGSNNGAVSSAAGGGGGGALVSGGGSSGSGLSSSVSLPSFLDIPCELRFHNKKLTLRPALEDLRSSYYRTLKKFLDLPKHFLGVYEPAVGTGLPPPNSIFASIPERNATGLHSLYAQAEGLFAQLRAVQLRYEPWMALGSIDLESYTSERLHSVLDWEVNFKALKARRKESEKLPDVVRVGCFVVSLASFKSALDDSMHRFQEALLLSLKKSTGSSLKRVGEFIDLAMSTLNATPSSIAEMGAAKTAFDRIQSEKAEMHALMDGMYEKDALLRQMANVTLDLSSIAPGWSLFLDSYSKFDDLLLEQKESLRQGLEGQIRDGTLAVDKLASRWASTKPSTEGNMNVTAEVASKIIEEIGDWQAQIASLRESCTEIQSHCEGFGMAVPSFEALDALEAEVSGYADSWSLFTSYASEVDKMVKEDWVAFRKEVSSFAALLDRWTNKLKQRGQRDAVFDYLAREIKLNRDVYPVLQLISADFLQNEHFKLLFSLLQFDGSITIRNVNLGHFLQANALVLRKRTEIRALVERAQGEVVIRESVENLKVWGDKTEFSLLEQTTSNASLGNTHIIREWKELFTQISDQQALVGSLKESPYFGPFADVAKQFEEKFVLLDEVLHALNLIQRKYLSLEPILSTGALPSESARFKRVDTEFRAIMKEVHDNPNVLALTNVPDLRSTVHSMLEQLERTQKALNDFLEEKRSKFPRFYFIGDDDLLEIIGQSENPLVIQNHLRKLFAGIATVEFSADQKKIVAMLSSEKERVQLLAPVPITPHVEEWLSALSGAMEATLQQLLLQALKEFDIARFPSQILNLAESIHFTADAEAAIVKGTLPTLHASLQTRLQEYTGTDTSDDHEDSALLQIKIKALVMDLIHNIDVVRQLMEAKVTTLTNWVWSKQLRYVLRDGLAWIQMVDAEFRYTYEYQGSTDKLVHTPLSDKCYLVLTQGMHLGYGGCPFGPAGTGKTESVKALGNAFGRQVLVFNCDEGIDFQSMGRIFTGLVKSGAWGCFDEFNRLKEDQLSAVSQQIQVIQAAIKAKDAECDLLGKVINVNPNAAIFVTMNPASREYGGRSKLPGSLKQLFRDISMALPDLTLIAQTILMAEGFVHAELVGRKVIEVFELSKQLLSQQRHYDWGLRAIKTVLRHAGQLIHGEKKKSAATAAGAAAGGAAPQPISQQTEASLLIGALKINTLSKLTYADSVRFNALINDVFPGAVDEDIDYGELTKNIRAALEELKLECVESQVKKILQLHAALHQRMGVVIVGPSGSGKSVMLNVLHTALGKMNKAVVRHVMNPKALERSKLLGKMDNDTREWTDGVLTAAARQVQREPTTTHTWIISDGDVDPEWIESLNSVLDDNHLLTMPNGERIKFGSNVNFVFETESLAHASPATVSRMGVIFLDVEETDIKSLVTAWIKKQDASLQMRLAGWMEEMFYGALEWVLEAGADVVERTKIGVVLTGLSHLRNVGAKAEFCVGLIRGLGCNLPLDRRTQFASKVWSMSGSEKALDSRAPLDCYWNKSTNSLTSYALREAPIALESISFRAPPVVDTVDVQRNRDLIMPWLQNFEPMILVGPDGCGRSLLLESCFRSLRHCTVATINCSAQTNASHVVQKLNDHCSVFSTNKGRVYRPKEGERLVLFLKDLNLPRPDKYDTIQLIAFLQQLVTYQGFYDDNLDWVGIDRGVQIVACMAPSTSVGRHALSTRFTASVHVAVMTYPERDQLVAIYTSFLKAVLAAAGANGLPDPTWKSEGNVRKLCGTLVDVYDKVRAKFSVDEQRHYAFNPRDLTQWLFGLLRYDLLKENLLDVIVYEAHRLFADRLVAPEQVKSFETILGALMNSHWKHQAKSTDVYFTSLQQYSLDAAAPSGAGEGESAKADLSVLATELGASLERVSGPTFKELCGEGLAVYEREYKNLNMLLFPEILDHIALEERVLSRPGGSLFLVGDSGVGRRSSVTLVCHMLRMTMVSPNMSRKYDTKSFRTDLKEYLRAAGVDGRQTLLYLEDHQFVTPEIIEDVNSLLSAGEVAGLYTPQEMDAMLSPLKEAFAASGLFKSLGEFFTSRVRANLHVVLSMDPRHPAFAMRCESNPAIFTRCTILWMGRWSKAGMAEIPREKLARMLSGGAAPAGAAAPGAAAGAAAAQGHHGHIDANRVLDTLLFIHHSALTRGLCATPLKYCAFVDTYARIFDRNQSGLVTQKKHLLAGLQKLTDAAAQVDVLSKDAQQKQAQVTTKQKEADQALEQITQRMSQASERKVEVEQLQKTLGGEEAKLNVRKEQIQNELRDIQPILEEARAAVGGIKKDNLNEIRAFRMPPTQIHAVLCGVLGLMKQEDTSWQNMKKFLGSPSVKEDILNFDVNAVDVQTRTKVQGLMAQNPDAFDKVKMMRVNVAAAPLAAWVQACVRYSAVLETVKPLRDSFEAATRQLDGARQRVKQCEQELQQLDAEVQKLKERFGKTTAEAETLKLALARTTEILASAQLLLGKLSGERNRWEAQVKQLSSGLDALTYNAMLAAAFTSYLGGCPEDERRSALAEWRDKAGLDSFDFMGFMSTESELLQWKAEGLPSDNLSMENSLVILNSVQVPFIIDPSAACTGWLRAHLGDKSEVVMQQEARFVTALELAVRFGKTLIIQESDGLIPLLFPIVRRDLVGQGPRKMIQIGEKSVDYNEGFKLFLVTRDPNPDLTPNARALVNEINFTVTRSGLEGQLLGVTLAHEKPQLEQKKSELLASEDQLKIQLAELEKRLLNELAESSGNILENKTLIESLNQTKTQSSEIAVSLASSKEIQSDLDRQREVYRPIAHVGSVLFFLVAQLSAVNNMYEFSLPSFIALFKQNLLNKDVAAPAPGAGGAAGSGGAEGARVEGLSTTLRLKIFTFITRSLFKNDRLMFALHFVHCLKPHLFGEREWEFFTGQIVGETNNRDVALPSWASKDRAAPFSTLVSTFPALVRSAKMQDEQSWGKWFKSARPEVEFPAPVAGEKALTPFQRLLLVKIMRPDRLQTALTHFACESIGVSTISPPPLNLQRIILEEGAPLTPVLFICEGGADPTQELEECAERSVGKANFHQVALGSGQTEGAMALVYRAAKEGHYLLLKNLHLVSPWLYELEKTLKLLTPHPQFRLILTTEVSESFPTILLQESLLISYESPPGIKQNLLRTYEGWDSDFIGKGSPVRAQLLFILAWFHAIVQERRTYLPQGWTKFYEFSFADLRSGADIIDNLFTKMNASRPAGAADIDPASFPWLSVWGLLKFAIYGGRIDNDHDVRVLVTYLRKFFAKDILSVGGAPASRKLTGGLEMPSSNSHADFMRLINRLPDQDMPVLFSLPENVEGAVQETQSAAVVVQLRKLAVSGSAMAKFDRDVWRAQLTPLLQLWERYATKDNRALLARPPRLAKKEEHYTPLEAFVVLENAKAYDLVHLVHGALAGLGAVVYSSGLLTADIASDGAALLAGQTPWRWARNWYGPSDPAAWITQISDRKASLQALLQRTDAGQLLSQPLILGQLFTPKVCLNALRQQTARQTGKAIDTLKLVASWDPALLASAPLRVTLDGLMLQGCGFQNGALSPLSPDSPSLAHLPPAVVAYIPKEEGEPYPDPQAALPVPVYVATSREEYVCEIRVPCKGQLDRWILAGAALFLNAF